MGCFEAGTLRFSAGASARQSPLRSSSFARSLAARHCAQSPATGRLRGCHINRKVFAQALGTNQRQDLVREARKVQLDATKLLALLLEAPDAARTAADNVNSLTEEFFTIASTYLAMAQKEGDAAVVSRLEGVLKTAMAEKQKTLRPEIQLLNRLLAVQTSTERKQVLNTAAAGKTLQMHDGYFFWMLERMTADVRQQPDNSGKGELLERLQACKADALERLPPAQWPAR